MASSISPKRFRRCAVRRQGTANARVRLHEAIASSVALTEVILLTAGRLSEASQYRHEFVKALLSARSQYENILHRDLLLPRGVC
jgi:hypothetical protein